MRLPGCKGCGLPVIELEGQFEKLDSLYLEDDGALRASAGYWHTRCLMESTSGAGWFDARRRSYVEVRRYSEIATTPSWSVVRSPRSEETVALSHLGESMSLVFASVRARPVEGGIIHTVVESPFNCELVEEEAIKTIQESLVSTGEFSICAFIDRLGIAGRISHPEALAGALFRYERSMRGEWTTTSVAARAEYGVFVPAEIAPFVTRARRDG